MWGNVWGGVCEHDCLCSVLRRILTLFCVFVVRLCLKHCVYMYCISPIEVEVHCVYMYCISPIEVEVHCVYMYCISPIEVEAYLHCLDAPGSPELWSTLKAVICLNIQMLQKLFDCFFTTCIAISQLAQI